MTRIPSLASLWLFPSSARACPTCHALAPACIHAGNLLRWQRLLANHRWDKAHVTCAGPSWSGAQFAVVCRYAVFPEDEDIGQLRSALQALNSAASPPSPPAAAPRIEWSDSATAAAANKAAAAAAAEQERQSQQTAQQPVKQQKARVSGLAAGAPASASAAALSEPRDRRTQASCCTYYSPLFQRLLHLCRPSYRSASRTNKSW